MLRLCLSVALISAPAVAQAASPVTCAAPSGARIAVPPRALLAEARNTQAPLEPPKAYAFYFGAAWCGPCRLQVRAMKPLYEAGDAARLDYALVFVSLDRDAAAAAAYVASEKMPWPYLPPGVELVAKAFGRAARSAPDMVVVDPEGRVLCRAYDGSGRYRGVAETLEGLRRSLGAQP